MLKVHFNGKSQVWSPAPVTLAKGKSGEGEAGVTRKGVSAARHRIRYPGEVRRQHDWSRDVYGAEKVSDDCHFFVSLGKLVQNQGMT